MFFRPAAPPDFAFLGHDCHSHLLPGIDDGAPDVDTSLDLIRGLRALGYHSFTATPHVLAELHPNTPATIGAALDRLRTALDATDDLRGLPLRAAAEYMLDESFTALLDTHTPLLTLDDTHRRILVELPQAGEPPQWTYQLFELQTRGYRPVLAHPERYRYLAGRLERLAELRANGVELQVNLLSVGGYYGQGPTKMAHQLLQQKLVDQLGTDLHHHRHLQALHTLTQQRRLMRQLQRALSTD